MLRPPTSLRLRSIDAAYRRAIETGPLWSYQPEGEQLRRASVATAQAAPIAATRPAAGWRSVVVDGRCLQHPDFADRGIGRYTAGFLTSLAEAAPSVAITVVLDDSLPAVRAGALAASINTQYRADLDLAHNRDALHGAIVLDPAPMTHEPSFLDPAAIATGARRMAIVYDFIPAEAPSVYLADAERVVAYTERLDRLARFDSLLCISQSVANDCPTYLGRTRAAIDVLPLPAVAVASEQHPIAQLPADFVFAAVGADRRKNLPGAVAALAGLAQLGWGGDLVILSHMPDEHRRELNALAEACRLDPTRVHVVAGLEDEEVAWLYAQARAVLVPSFSEGLSLPVLEAADAGCPVVASDIAPHRELLGASEPLCDPRRPSTFARQLAHVLEHPAPTVHRQRSAIDRLRHERDVVSLAAQLVG
ncbi:MAG: glycosyltransferase [Acidimicrobiales bacterium]